MESTTKTTRERLRAAFRMGQDPIDRLWAVVIVLIVMVLAVGLFLLDIRQYLGEERDLGFGRTATDCLEIIVDNDRDFDLPENCTRNEVVIHYPSSVCETFFPGNNYCGDEWGEP